MVREMPIWPPQTLFTDRKEGFAFVDEYLLALIVV